MSVITPSAPRRSRDRLAPAPRALATPGASPAPAPGPRPTLEARADPQPLPHPDPHGRGGVAMFQVPFRSAMSDADLAVLARGLDLSTHMYPKMRPDPNSPGVARLDHFSGLFLERGAGERRWMLEGRTWGQPAPDTVHSWHLLAAQAARQLDPSVTLPEPMPGTVPSIPDHAPGRTGDRRLTRLRRRLAGL